MGNTQKLDQWATNTSTRTEPDAGDKATGFVAAEQATGKNMNWLLGETIDKTNEVIDDGTISGFDDSVGMAPIIQRYIPAADDAGWSQPFDTPNLIDHGATLAWVDLCAHVTTAGVREILALDGNSAAPTCQISRFDAHTLALNGVSGNLSTGNLPSGGGEVWVPCAMCSDGTSVYVTFKDFNVTPNETHRIQAYNISNWARKSGWPATGTALPGTGTCASTYCHGDVEIATSTQIVTTNSWVTAPGNCLSVIGMADGVIDVSGDGDGTAQAKYVVSDGTHVYFTNTGFDISSADIATLAAGKGGDFPYNGVSTCVDVAFDGKRLHSTWQETGPSVVLRSFLIDAVPDYFGACGSGDIEIVEYLGKCAWDGQCLWARVQLDRNGTPKSAVARIDTGLLCYKDNATATAQRDVENLVKTVMIIDHDATVAGLFQESAPIIFDGRDIWLAGDSRSGQTLSGKIYRIPKACMR